MLDARNLEVFVFGVEELEVIKLHDSVSTLMDLLPGPYFVPIIPAGYRQRLPTDSIQTA